MDCVGGEVGDALHRVNGDGDGGEGGAGLKKILIN
jgi:hypothetical protein